MAILVDHVITHMKPNMAVILDDDVIIIPYNQIRESAPTESKHGNSSGSCNHTHDSKPHCANPSEKICVSAMGVSDFRD